MQATSPLLNAEPRSEMDVLRKRHLEALRELLSSQQQALASHENRPLGAGNPSWGGALARRVSALEHAIKLMESASDGELANAQEEAAA